MDLYYAAERRDFPVFRFVFRNAFRQTATGTVVYTLHNIRYLTDVEARAKTGSIELVKDASGKIGWREVGKQADNVVGTVAKGAGNHAKFLDDAFTQARKAEIVAEKLPGKFPNHTVEELTAIKTYTSDQVRNGTKVYESLNTQLRSGNLDDFNRGLNDLLNSGLNKLDAYKGREGAFQKTGGTVIIA